MFYVVILIVFLCLVKNLSHNHPDYTKTEEEFMQDLANGKLSTMEDENPQWLDFYLLNDNTYAVSAGNSIYLSQIVIPNTYKGKPVTKVIDSSYKDNQYIRSVVIGDNVKEIGEDAFNGCGCLLSITIGTNVEKISPHSFSNT